MHSIEIEWIPTQRTRAGVARLEPFEQTTRMEEVLAGRTAFGRQLFVGADDRIADGTFGLALESARDILAPCRETVGDTPVLFHSLVTLPHILPSEMIG